MLPVTHIKGVLDEYVGKFRECPCELRIIRYLTFISSQVLKHKHPTRQQLSYRISCLGSRRHIAELHIRYPALHGLVHRTEGLSSRTRYMTYEYHACMLLPEKINRRDRSTQTKIIRYLPIYYFRIQ